MCTTSTHAKRQKVNQTPLMAILCCGMALWSNTVREDAATPIADIEDPRQPSDCFLRWPYRYACPSAKWADNRAQWHCPSIAHIRKVWCHGKNPDNQSRHWSLPIILARGHLLFKHKTPGAYHASNRHIHSSTVNNHATHWNTTTHNQEREMDI